MRNSQYLFKIIGLLLISILLAACDADMNSENAGTELREDGDPQVIDVTPRPDEMTGDDAGIEANQSAYNGIVLTVNTVMVTESQDGAAAGTLNIDITLENTGNETQTLDLEDADYSLVDPAGLATAPTTIDDVLITPELEGDESVSGTISYAVTDPVSTYILAVTNFEDIEVDE